MSWQTLDTTGTEVEKIRQGFSIVRRGPHGKLNPNFDNIGPRLKLRSALDPRHYFYEFEYPNTNEENGGSQNATKVAGDVPSSTDLLYEAARRLS